jgi:hypothetical protein
MRIRSALPLILGLLLAACGGAVPGATTKPNTQASAATGSTGQPPGQVDCAEINTAAQQLLAVQLLAQLTTPDTVAAIKSKSIGNLDLDAFLSAMTELHALDAVSSPLGNAKESIDAYQKAATAAKALFAMEPVTQAAIDAYNQENVGTVGEFLGRQVAISGAIDAAGC